MRRRVAAARSRRAMWRRRARGSARRGAGRLPRRTTHRSLPFEPASRFGSRAITFLPHTLIATPTAQREVANLVPDDPILAGSLVGGVVSWSPRTLQYAEVVSDAYSPSPMIRIVHAEGLVLTVSPDQLLLIAGLGRLKRADHLAGSDRLVTQAGGEATIARVEPVTLNGPLIDIATAHMAYDAFSGQIDTHLIVAGGLVVGDYVLQTFQATDKMHDHMARRA